jgi:hypothetical protein
MEAPATPMSSDLPATKPQCQNLQAALKTLEKALSGGNVSREDVREALRHFPDVARHAGDLAGLAETSLIRLAGRGQVVFEEALRIQINEMRNRLAQPGDGELERLLIHRVVLASFTADLGERARLSKWQESISPADATFWDNHCSRLQADLVRACRALAQVRALARPTVLAQLNVAEQQIVLGQGQPMDGRDQ